MPMKGMNLVMLKCAQEGHELSHVKRVLKCAHERHELSHAKVCPRRA